MSVDHHHGGRARRPGRAGAHGAGRSRRHRRPRIEPDRSELPATPPASPRLRPGGWPGRGARRGRRHPRRRFRRPLVSVDPEAGGRCDDHPPRDRPVLLPLSDAELPVRRPDRGGAVRRVAAPRRGGAASLGIKLGRPSSTVIATLGDGAYFFGQPPSCHFVSRAENLPILTVLFNNRRWEAVKFAALGLHPDGWARSTSHVPLTELTPSP